jgi:metal-sulfur cluster biosynthetic enzyme
VKKTFGYNRSKIVVERSESMDKALEENLMGALENVLDPELGVDIVNLGLVYGVDMDDEGVCTVTMTLTAMGCPLAGEIESEVKKALVDLPEVKDTNVDIVWNPPWSKDKMSRYAKIALGIAD